MHFVEQESPVDCPFLICNMASFPYSTNLLSSTSSGQESPSNSSDPPVVSKPLLLYGTCNHRTIRILLDTGSSLPIVKESILPENSKIHDGKSVEIDMAQNVTGVLNCFADIELSLDSLSSSLKFKETCYISPNLNVDLIIGMGTLQRHPFVIDFANMKLRLDDFEFKFYNPKAKSTKPQLKSSQPEAVDTPLLDLIDARYRTYTVAEVMDTIATRNAKERNSFTHLMNDFIPFI